MEEALYDGQALKQAYKSAEAVLEKRIEEINSLNVFPVPDGDTGINMFLTLQSANEAIKDLTSNSAAEISSKAAMGALLGARGNSGVILSQIMRGISKGLDKKEKFTALDFAQALHHASDTAYKSLAEPVEGTILTVIREAADRALQQANQGGNLRQTLRAATSQAKDTVTRTPEMLPTLKAAGVVDAGGKGLFYFFLGMRNFLVQKMNPVEGYKAARRKAGFPPENTVYGYDLQFLIEGQNMPIEEIRDKVTSMGESVLVVGDGSLIRVHIHTKDSQKVMDYCSSKGCLKDIINDNMDNQVKAYHDRHDGDDENRKSTRSKSKPNRSREDDLSRSTVIP